MALRSFFIAAIAISVSSSTTEGLDIWQPVRDILDTWGRTQPLMPNFCFSVGNATNRLFTHEVGTCTMKTVQHLASASKMPAMAAIMGAVQDGHLGLNDFAHQYLPYWTRSPTDNRSKITLRHLLSFTSGYYASGAGADLLCVDGLPILDFDKCVKKVYDKVPLTYAPGTVFDYNSYHLQIAGAMAAHATKLTASELLDKYLIKRLGMEDTTYGKRNPGLAATMQTTGDDYDIFLRAYLNYSLLSPELCKEVERDYTTNVSVTNKTQFLVDFIGHYGFSHWVECLDNNGTWPHSCATADVHSDPGLFGYYPLVDRKYNYYFQQVYTGPASNTSDLRATSVSMELREQVKPVLDSIIQGLRLHINQRRAN